MKKVDVIIPTYKPGTEFVQLLNMLHKQTVSVNRIIVMNTEKAYLDPEIEKNLEESLCKKVSFFHVSKEEFDHGATRHAGAMQSDADYMLMMTQDAMPVDDRLLELMIAALERDNVAVAYGRQLARPDSGIIEQTTRRFNYPETSHVKTIEDLPRLGIKTYFCSNVCAMYKREIYLQLGGFIKRTIFNEDMIYAATAAKAGYAIAYAADAMVYHSHDYTCMQQFHRNFDLGVSQGEHPEIFANVPSATEGTKMVKSTVKIFLKQKKFGTLVYFCFQCAYKYLGYLLGKNFKRLPKWLVMKCTMSPAYFKREKMQC
ncbi:MAG: glycosyltransferase family 2 protein [Lachnospiraceae bacterium]|nr:glycosyltransferase family 2 protein [Lachnospiraceae bacterium]